MFTKISPEHMYHPGWPEARWNISGLFPHGMLIKMFIEYLKRYKMLHVVESFHGTPDLIWNGGRPNRNLIYPAEAEAYFKSLNEEGLGVLFTFSNNMIEKQHLDDRVGNTLLDCLDESCGLNGVIVVSDVLSDYIRRRKPGLRQVSSILKSFFENHEGKLSWYKEMEGRFDQVVIHTDHMFNRELMDGLDRNKAEILVNENCFSGCPNRRHHQALISRWNVDVGQRKEVLNKLKVVLRNCLGGGRGWDEERNPEHVRTCTLSHLEVKALYDMGFRKFKIAGRHKTPYALAWHMLHYLANPDISYMIADGVYSTLPAMINKIKRPNLGQPLPLVLPGKPGEAKV